MQFLLVVNPKAGRHRALKRGRFVQTELESRGHNCALVETTGPGHATGITRDHAGEFDSVVAVGGDGTVHEVIMGLLPGGLDNGASSRPGDLPNRTLLGIVPAGSGDSLAMDLGIGNEREAAARLHAGRTGRIDLARVDLEPGDAERSSTRFAANVLAWGAGARINRRAEYMRWAGSARYNLATVVELIRMGEGSDIPKVDGETRAGDLLGIASLTRFSGRGLQLAPRAKLDDGLIDLVHIARSSRLHLARTFGAVFKGAHLGMQGVSWRQTEAFDLDLGPQGELVLDGELLACCQARITVCPGLLTLIR